MFAVRRLVSLVCMSSLAAAALQQSLLSDSGPVWAAAELRAAAATVYFSAEEGSETGGGEVVENEEALLPPLSRLPSLAETRAAILASTTGIDCSSNQRCLQTPVAAVRDYLRTLSARIQLVAKTQLDLEDETLTKELTKLGCLNVGIIDLQGLQATVGLFKQGVVSRVRIDKAEMARYGGRCDNKLLPLTFHQHEFGRNAVSRGQFNENGACNPENTGGHHDPGFACGPTGAVACKDIRIEPSSCVFTLLSVVLFQHQTAAAAAAARAAAAAGAAAAPILLVLVLPTGSRARIRLVHAAPTLPLAVADASADSAAAAGGTPMHTGEYRCTPDIYEKRPFACHAGDLSGKVGAGINVSPDSNRPDFRLLALDSHADNTCVASDNKHSLVLHCEATNFRLACAPFERVETAGKRIPELLHELIRVARNALPHSKNQSSLLASLVLVHELEQRVAALETALQHPSHLMLLQLQFTCSCSPPAVAAVAAVHLLQQYCQLLLLQFTCSSRISSCSLPAAAIVAAVYLLQQHCQRLPAATAFPAAAAAVYLHLQHHNQLLLHCVYLLQRHCQLLQLQFICSCCCSCG
ncbi:hypothetical protein ACSSS7_007375 [Eimeria intestinalis]